MAKAAFRLYLDNAPATAEQLALFTEIRIDQGIGVACEAELDLPVGTDVAGLWSGIEEDYAQPFARVRIEVKVADADFTPLIDGPLVGNRYEMKFAPGQSTMTLVVQDDSVLLSRDEKVALFEDMAPSDIVTSLFSDAGLTAEVDAAPDAGAALQRVVVQRGTSMHLLRDLAKRHGMFTYVKPGAAPGVSVGVFKKPQFDATDLPEITLVGAECNVASFSAQFDALRPIKAKAGSVALADRSVLTASVDAADNAPLGDSAAHDFTQPAVILLTGTREEQTDLDAAASATVDLSSWAYAATGEIDADKYEGVMQPHHLVRVRGIGGYLSGDYLIGHVTHVLNDHSYRQRFSLHRNARSAGSAGGGGLTSGVF
jgi:phage protein D